jgi:hypothetical protein
MPSADAKFLVDPLFHEALGGEFQPGIDPTKTHTMSRLLIATLQRGQLTDKGEWGPTIRGDLGYDIGYTPSWAPGVVSRALCSERSGYAWVTGIHLTNTASDEPGNFISLYDDREQGTDLRRITMNRVGKRSSSDNEHLLLDLGSALEVARVTVAEAAKEFFS